MQPRTVGMRVRWRWAGLALLVAGSAQPSLAGAKIQHDKSALGRTVAAALVAEPKLSAGSELRVAAKGTEVHLTGRAANLFEKELAARVAEGCEGAGGLIVAVTLPATPVSGEALTAFQEQVARAAVAAGGEGLRISVRDIGVVVIETGELDTDRAVAIGDAVKRVPGVRAVEAEGKLRHPATTGSGELRAQLERSLEEAGIAGVEVDAEDGVVTLRGEVDGIAKALEAKRIATRRPDVRALHDELRIVSARQPARGKQLPTDATIDQSIRRDLEASLGSKAMAGLSWRVADGVVTVAGDVPSEARALLVCQTVSNVPGVKAVIDTLRRPKP